MKLTSEPSEVVVASVRWPIPYDHQANRFEIVGRYIAQVLLMERFIDLSLLDDGVNPRVLRRMKLARKIDHVRALVAREELRAWADLPDMMTKVARHRNDFAHENVPIVVEVR